MNSTSSGRLGVKSPLGSSLAWRATIAASSPATPAPGPCSARSKAASMRSGLASVIPACLRFHLHDPGVGAEGGDAAGLGEEAVPSLACSVGDGVVVVE